MKLIKVVNVNLEKEVICPVYGFQHCNGMGTD
jgi:hypothetical protein